MTLSQAGSFPSDPGLPGARGLLGDGGTARLAAFLGRRGWTLEEARPVQVTYRPGRSCLVRYRVRSTGPAGRRILTLCAETRADRSARTVTPPEGFEARFGIADPVESGADVTMWAFPYDPSLRELPAAASGDAVRRLRREQRAAAISVQPLRYRPRRRAVFRYRGLYGDRRGRSWRTEFGKVIPSRKAGRAVDASARLAAAGIPVALPAQLGRQTVLLPEMPGRSLRELLVRGGSLPAPERLADLIWRIAAHRVPDLTWTRPTADAVAASSAKLVAALRPDLAADVGRVLDEVGDPPAALRPVHGDLYEAQVFVRPGYGLGLIDLDDVAIGDPAMDAANVCAHLLVLALAVPAASARLTAYRRLARLAFLDVLGISSPDLAWREAVCILQLATGPFRVLDARWPDEVGRRVRLAVRLLEGV